ncbi:MAG: hypothetical protein HY047_11190 [Acidobacteria bacterium]|nr:hypothetical protein [Acidobacteriota bacterium]
MKFRLAGFASAGHAATAGAPAVRIVRSRGTAASSAAPSTTTTAASVHPRRIDFIVVSCSVDRMAMRTSLGE